MLCTVTLSRVTYVIFLNRKKRIRSHNGNFNTKGTTGRFSLESGIDSTAADSFRPTLKSFDPYVDIIFKNILLGKRAGRM